jgi:diaminopimelate epimerase
MAINLLSRFRNRAFYKLQALGNSYIVIDSQEWPEAELSSDWIAQLCSKEWGIGSDGLLWGPGALASESTSPRLRIFNTDGSEAEKSGNGIRIFSRYLRDQRNFPAKFQLSTLGGLVMVEDLSDKSLRVAMGKGRLLNGDCLEDFDFSGRLFRGVRVDVGNPHCVLFEGIDWNEASLKEWGPRIEVDPMFPKRSNVQWVRVKDRQTLEILIWERGSGYTLASGSSSCAAAFAAYKLGKVDKALCVEMPGGQIFVEIDSEDAISMRGAVDWIAQGSLR